jgi:hypothetical protein
MVSVSGVATNVSTTDVSNDTALFFLGTAPLGDWGSIQNTWKVTGTGIIDPATVKMSWISKFGGNTSVHVQITDGEFTQGETYTIYSPSLACFAEGTRVLTEDGYKAIESLGEGARIFTSDRHAVPFKIFKTVVPDTTYITAPYLIQPGAFGPQKPSAPVRLSPSHKILIGDGLWISPERAAETNPLVKQEKAGRTVTYYHIECGNYLKDNLITEGLIVESYGLSKAVRDLRVRFRWNDALGGFQRYTLAPNSSSTSS